TDPRLERTPVGCQNIPLVAAKLLGANAPGPSPSHEKSTDSTDAYAAKIGCFLVGVTPSRLLERRHVASHPNMASPFMLVPCPVGSLTHKERFTGIPSRLN